MSEKKYSKTTFKLLRGLRETTDESELQLELARASRPSSPPRKKVIPVYGLSVLAHCPKYGGFWRPKVIGHEIVNVDDGKEDCMVRKPVTQEHGDVSVSDADVCHYKKYDAYKSKPVSDIKDTPASVQTVTGDLSQYADPTYKILRGLRRLDDGLAEACNALPEIPVNKPPKVRVIPTYGQPVLVHCARYGTFRQWKLVSHELVRPGQAAAEEFVPEDVCADQFVEEEPQFLPMDDEAYRHYKKHDSYAIVKTEDNPEKLDDASSVSPVAPAPEEQIAHPQATDYDDDDIYGIFGVYARSH